MTADKSAIAEARRNGFETVADYVAALATTPAPEQPACHICGKQKGQPPERCPGHYAGTASSPEQSNEQEGR